MSDDMDALQARDEARLEDFPDDRQAGLRSHIVSVAAKPCQSYSDPYSCLDEPPDDHTPDPMWVREDLCRPCLVRAALKDVAERVRGLPLYHDADGGVTTTPTTTRHLQLFRAAVLALLATDRETTT